MGSARPVSYTHLCIVEALPAIVWRLADPLCITLCAACIVRLARLDDRPAGRWAVCGLALCYPWQDMSSAGWVCTTLVFVWPLLAEMCIRDRLVMDENDEVLRTVDKLLTGAVSMDIYEVKAACCLLYTSRCV